ncbi:MAG: glycosyltransferase [bacterium]
MQTDKKKIKIAFIVGQFPAISETFIINQVADLMDSGVEVEIFSLRRGDEKNISQRFFDYKMEESTNYLNMPENFLERFLKAIPKIIKIFLSRPLSLFKALNFIKYGRDAFSLKLIFWCEQFLGKKFDLVHCHFGPIANKFLIIKDILGLQEKFVTTFYGYDVSRATKMKRGNYYDRLKKECPMYFVMSENMKERVVAQGFDAEKIKVLPISIDVSSYPFKERNYQEGEQVDMVSVGRFVEKKGLDDLLRALAIVKKKTNKPFKCVIIGDGYMKKELLALTDKLDINNEVDYKGYIKIEEVINIFLESHLYLQPSKTAKDGDME